MSVKPITPIAFAKLKAQVQSGHYEWSVLGIGRSDSIRALNDNLLETYPLRYHPPDRLSVPVPSGTNGISRHSVLHQLGLQQEEVPQRRPPSPGADYWKRGRSFPGNRGAYSDVARMAPFALLADGVPKDKLYPLDVDRAFKKLDELKPHVKVWWKTRLPVGAAHARR